MPPVFAVHTGAWPVARFGATAFGEFLVCRIAEDAAHRTDLDQCVFGESVYSKRTPSERFTEIVVKDLIDLTNAATRRIEQMSSSLLFTGSFSYRLDSGETESLVYGTIHSIVPGTKWDAADSDPLGDLRTAVNQIVSQSGLMPDTLILGSNVMSTFLSDPSVQDTLNKLNVSLGSIAPASQMSAPRSHAAGNKLSKFFVWGFLVLGIQGMGFKRLSPMGTPSADRRLIAVIPHDPNLHRKNRGASWTVSPNWHRFMANPTDFNSSGICNQ